jgi:hypothetical protein
MRTSNRCPLHGTASSTVPIAKRLHDWLTGRAEEIVLRWIFRSILIAAVVVLALDLAQLNGWFDSSAALQSTETQQDVPASDTPALPEHVVKLPQPDGVLASPISFELRGGGRLMASGTITAGSAQAFTAEVDKHREYIKTVVLNSPGGSVADALAIGRLIRARKFATEVEPGKYCASSCPLVFAGGVERRAGNRAVIGVHQIAALKSAAANASSRDEMSLAQNVSARCERYLLEMGVNLQVWVHAMETPNDKLFIFKPDELKSLNFVTAPPESPPEKPRT